MPNPAFEIVIAGAEEGEIAGLLDQLCEQHPDVTLGSYPRLGDSATRVDQHDRGFPRDGGGRPAPHWVLVGAAGADRHAVTF